MSEPQRQAVSQTATPDEALLAAVREERLAAEAAARASVHEPHVVEDEAGRMLGVACACKLWALDLPLGSDPAVRAAATADIQRAHQAHVTERLERQARFRFGDPGLRCRPLYEMTPQGARSFVGFVCGQRAPRRRCDFCRLLDYVRLCDFPVGGTCPKCKAVGGKKPRGCRSCAGTGRKMCNRPVCTACVASRPLGSDSEDYCPGHRVAAGFPALIWREECRWLDRARFGGACLHRGCPDVIEPGQMRVLFFPKRGRVMCSSCGDEYLMVSTKRPGR